MILQDTTLTQRATGRRSRKGQAQKEQLGSRWGGMKLVLESLYVTHFSNACTQIRLSSVTESELHLWTVYPHRQPVYATQTEQTLDGNYLKYLGWIIFLTCRGIEPRTLHMLGKLSPTELLSQDLKLLYLCFSFFSIKVQHKAISTTITTILH